jgi:hypothetical protein
LSKAPKFRAHLEELGVLCSPDLIWRCSRAGDGADKNHLDNSLNRAGFPGDPVT